MLVKICGLTRAEDAAAAVAAGAHLLGFVFVPGTPRAVDPDRASWIRDLPVATVGVFRDPPLDEVLRIRDLLALDWVQLHGDEPDSWIARLGGRVLRRVPATDPFDWQRVTALSGHCLPLVDPGGGDGRAFDWHVLADAPPGSRFGLAGGLRCETVAEAIRLARPQLVDVSSGVESAPGIKDHDALRRFVAAARNAAS